MPKKPKKVVAIVQARLGSIRLPKKVMADVNGTTLINLLLKRLKNSKKIDQILLATSDKNEDDELERYIKSLGFDVYRGKENDVLDRFAKAASLANADVIVRITGDCPLIDSYLVDEIIELYFNSKADYASNREPPTFPDGLDVEVMSFSALQKANEVASNAYDREHVTPFIINSKDFKKNYLRSPENLSDFRWTVDEKDDLDLVRFIFKSFAPRINFSYQEILNLAASNSELFRLNSRIKRNEGGEMNTGNKLWRRAKSIIPGGNMLLSKRPEMFAPELWPAYFSKAKGCKVWDLDNREFTDMSLMGVGTNILGYGNDEVDESVKVAIQNGNLSTLNCAEEVELSSELLSLHSWADMVRLARTGGEANAIAIRIARAASGKEKVAICGYHGWHDWYLSANLADDKNLDGHLLAGLTPNGVPRELKGSVIPFSYNAIDELEKLISTNDIGVIKMEVSRNFQPKDNFLQKVRAIASKHNIILIFDECSSGFRQSLGGLHKVYEVEPDICIFGKALGNGYAITAVIGRREVMDIAQSTFISSTFWTERSGPTAAVKTLEVMKSLKSWEVITRVGKEISNGWQDLAKKYKLDLSVTGIPSMASFKINSNNWLKYKTYIVQEMLKENILATNTIYVSVAHKQSDIKNYFDVLDKIMNVIALCENDDFEIDQVLDGPICHSGFQRLN